MMRNLFYFIFYDTRDTDCPLGRRTVGHTHTQTHTDLDISQVCQSAATTPRFKEACHVPQDFAAEG